MSQHQMAWYGKGHGKGGPPPSGPPGRDDIVKADIGNAIKGKDKSEWGKSKLATPQNIFLIVGSILLIMLSVVPVWNAIVLLQDRNYIFWAGRSTPAWIIGSCVLLVPLYAICVLLFFRRATGSVHTEQTIMMIANIFITLFGLILMMASLPLTHQAEITYTNLIHRCDYSEQTHRLYEYSQVLHNIRAEPECAKKYSIEECKGYEEAPPYTSFLKGMEDNFKCSGFCYRTWKDHTKSDAAAGEPKALLSMWASVEAEVNATAHSATAARRHRHEHQITPLALATEGEEVHSGGEALADDVYPPTLFSDQNYKASCEGMSARDMRNFAGDIGHQTFFQGIYLVLIAVITGFLKLMGFCMKKQA